MSVNYGYYFNVMIFRILICCILMFSCFFDKEILIIIRCVCWDILYRYLGSVIN